MDENDVGCIVAIAMVVSAFAIFVALLFID